MKTYHLTNPYMHGEELKPLQKELHSIGLYHGAIDGIFGSAMGHACQQAKWRFGYPARAVVPTGGQTLMNYLDGAEQLPPDYVKRRRTRGYGLNLAQKQRNAIVEYALWGAQNAGSIHYAEVRPMDHLHSIKTLPWTADCSEFVTTLYCWAGAPDPNGMNYNGEGYTGTLFNHGVGIPLFQAKPADLVLWGGPPGHHVAVITDITDKADPMIVSLGSEPGPYHFNLSQETAAQQRPYFVRQYIR